MIRPYYRPINFILIAIFCSLVSGADNTKLAQTGFQFLSVTSDARAGGMGEAMTTFHTNSSALFFNPAGMARQKNPIDLSLSQNQWIADINHNALSVSLTPANGKYGVIGLSFVNVDYGELQGTMVWDNEQGFIDTEIIKPSALALGVGYAKALSDKFSVGGQIKSAYQYLGKSIIPDSDTTQALMKNTADAIAFDFGTIYHTGWKSFTFGMSVRNFSQEIKFQTEGFQLPLLFTIGASMNLFDLFLTELRSQSLYLSVDALHPRSFSERLNIGLEYSLMDMLVIRTGYLMNYDERDFSGGIGVQKTIGPLSFGIDYAYTPFGVFDNVQRMSLYIAF